MKKVDRTLVELQEIASKTVKNNNNNNNNNKNYNNNDSNNNNSHIQSSISKNSNSNLKMEESKVKTLNVCLLGMKAAHHPTHTAVYATHPCFLAKEVCHHIYYAWGVAATTTFLAAKAEEWNSPHHIQQPYLLCMGCSSHYNIFGS